MKKWVICSIFEESHPVTRHCPALRKIPKTAKTCVIGISYDDVIKDFNFKELTNSDDFTGYFDVGF